MGVSGGGGDPRVALVVDVEAVEEKRFIVLGVGAYKLLLLAGSPSSSGVLFLGGAEY